MLYLFFMCVKYSFRCRRGESLSVPILVPPTGVSGVRVNCFNSVLIQIQSPALPSPVGIKAWHTHTHPSTNSALPLLNLKLNGLEPYGSLRFGLRENVSGQILRGRSVPARDVCYRRRDLDHLIQHLRGFYLGPAGDCEAELKWWSLWKHVVTETHRTF